jgi:tetratricopeptide (TPR) repeat protein
LVREDLELLAAAAYLLGHVEECRQALQRAHHAYVEAGDHRRAARCVFWVAFTLLLQGDLAQAGGWLARANRLLELEQQDCAEYGLLLLPVAVQASAVGDYATAQASAARAAGIGARFGDADLLALALHFQGRALVQQGRVREGLALLDEAMVAVVAGEVWAPVAGNIYCSMIDACQEIADLRRAQEWTVALVGWWGTQPDLVTFTRQCLVHRAEIMQLRGRWPAAIAEARRACERFAHAADQYATGAAWYRRRRSTESWGSSRRRRRRTAKPAGGVTSHSRVWPCSDWLRATPRGPSRRSAASSPRPSSGSGGPSCSPPSSRSC